MSLSTVLCTVVGPLSLVQKRLSKVFASATSLYIRVKKAPEASAFERIQRLETLRVEQYPEHCLY